MNSPFRFISIRASVFINAPVCFSPLGGRSELRRVIKGRGLWQYMSLEHACSKFIFHLTAKGWRVRGGGGGGWRHEGDEVHLGGK